MRAGRDKIKTLFRGIVKRLDWTERNRPIEATIVVCIELVKDFSNLILQLFRGHRGKKLFHESSRRVVEAPLLQHLFDGHFCTVRFMLHFDSLPHAVSE